MTHSNNNKKYFFEIDKYEDDFTLIEDRFCFELKDEKGNTYLRSLPYTRKTNCQEGIKSVMRNSKNEDRFIYGKPYEEKWIFYLRDEKRHIIAESPCLFDTEEEVINMIKDLKSLTLETPIIDKTKLKN